MPTRPRSRAEAPPRPPRRDPLAWSRVPDVTAAEGFAIKALYAGTATADQQQRAIAFIAERICKLEELPFVLDRDGGERATTFMLGRQSVGFALRAIRDLPVDKLRSSDE